MNKYFYTFLITIVFSFFSCIKEYQIFYPYKNTKGLSYLSQLQPRTKILKFENDSLFAYTSEMGLAIRIPGNSFENITGKINLHIENLGLPGDFISGRISLEDQNKRLISGYEVFSFNFTDDSGNDINLRKGAFVEFKIPYNEIKVPSIYKYHNEKWIEQLIDSEQFLKTTWEVTKDEGTFLQKGYIFKTDTEGRYCLGTGLDAESNIDKYKVSLPPGFDVNNSIVQIYFENINTNLEMYWDGETKTFQLPNGVRVPAMEGRIIVLSENSESQPFFGMKSAVVKQGNYINIDVSKKTIEDLKNILSNL